VSVGDAAITGAGELRSRYVIHAASMSLGGRTTAQALRSSMDASFRIAREHDVETIAVPAVGTGIASFPLDECARIMADCLRRAKAAGWHPHEVRFVLYDEAAMDAFATPFHAIFDP
jgi:O-acetyl-ADP-ribose deacetylase (regulator of RNase III)